MQNLRPGYYIILFDKPLSQQNPAFHPSRVNGVCTCHEDIRRPLAETTAEITIHMLMMGEPNAVASSVIHWSEGANAEHGAMFGAYGGENDRNLQLLMSYIRNNLHLDPETHTCVYYQPEQSER